MSIERRLTNLEEAEEAVRAEIAAWLEQASDEEIYAAISRNLPGNPDASKMDPEELKVAMRAAGFPE